MKTTSLTLTLLLAAAAAGPAQQAGHATLPTTGPVARERTEPPDADPLLVQVDRLRDDLAALGKRYRKSKGAEREGLARRAQPVLDEMASRLRDLAQAQTRESPR
jgi:hypothetical protein